MTPAPAPPVSPAPAPVAPPAPSFTSVARLDTVRVSRTLHRTVEVQRVVLELSGAAPHSVSREARGLSVSCPA
ncbi:hypothetical protein ACFSC4_08625 [Deinococcus malanensis]|uniref:hypothetical protein n=1 Tax=Deinococcus malanensis TaxID=1706855 RepID=UPI003640091F